MKQADSALSTTRRLVLVGAATLPAVTAVSAHTARDAELIAHSRKYSELVDEYERRRELELPNRIAWENAMSELCAECERDGRSLSDEEYTALYEHIDCAVPPPSPSSEDVLDEMFLIEKAVMRTPADTLAGLKVKALAVRFWQDRLWETPIDDL